MRIVIPVEINPAIGRVYQFQGTSYQCSRIDVAAEQIEIIPDSDSTPRLVSYGKFFMLFGISGGR